jgi:tetratricopeptide (TPR) repeat protein
VPLNNLGSVLESLGKSKEAKPYYVQALEMRNRLYPGSDHPNIAMSLNNLGGVLDSLKDLKEAKLYFEKAFEMRKRLYPNSDHPDIAMSLNNVGISSNNIDYIKQAYLMRERLFGKKHHHTISSMFSYTYKLCLNPVTRSQGIALLKVFKKEIHDDTNSINRINSMLIQFESNVGRDKSKRKK